MSLVGLVRRNVTGSGFRSLVIVLSVMVMAGFLVTSTVVLRGAEDSLQRGLSRLGADVVVVAEDAEEGVETALLMGAHATQTFPAAVVGQVARVPGVAAVSPQLYLGETRLSPGGGLVNLVAFDPASDFSVQPWLAAPLAAPLGPGQAVAGSAVVAAGGDATIDLGGCALEVAGRLEATGNRLDHTLFVSFETARGLRDVLRHLDPPLELKDEAYSAVLVRFRADADQRIVAPRILQEVPGVLPVESPGMFRALQKQMAGLAQGALTVLTLVWGLSVMIVALVFSMSADERRREVAVFRALGSTKRFVFACLILEAALLALAGGVLGVLLSCVGVYLLRGAIEAGFSIPFLFPAVTDLAVLMGAGVGLALVSGTLAAVWPAWRLAGQDPALAMRE